MQTDGQTDTQAGMKKLSQICNTPKNYVNEIIQAAVTEQIYYLHMKNIPIKISPKLFIT
jgi:hypothetical protein